MRSTPRILALAASLLIGGSALASGVNYRADQVPGTAEQVAAGKATFATCAGCHGPDGEGKVGTAPRLNSASYLSIVSDEFLTTTIRDGRAQTNMIPWGNALDAAAIASVVAYVRSWQSTDAYPLDASPLKANVAMGGELFRAICSHCHGRGAKGYIESGSGTGIGGKAFLDAASDATLRALIHAGKDNTPMRPFDQNDPTAVANLSDEEIDAIISYLRANAW